MKAKAVLKSLLCSYTLTGVLLLILAFLLFKMDLSEAAVSVGIIVIYILSCFLGVLLLGRKMKKMLGRRSLRRNKRAGRPKPGRGNQGGKLGTFQKN